MHKTKNCITFAAAKKMVGVAQLVRASDCGSEGRGFEPRSPPQKEEAIMLFLLFCWSIYLHIFNTICKFALKIFNLMRKVQCIIFVLLLFFSFFASAQNTPIIDRLTSNDGLSHNTIRCILKDTTGFLWFGSLSGLNRYDGIQIKNIDVNSQNSVGLSSEKIRELHNDSRGYIWVRTYSDNFRCYNPFTEQFITFFDAEKSAQRFNLFYEDKDKNIWLGSVNAGCVRISFDNDKATTTAFNHINKENSLPSDSVNDVFQDSHNRVWLLTEFGIRILKGKNLEKPNNSLTNAVPYFKAFEFDNKVFLITKTGRIDVYNLQNDLFEESITPNQKFNVFKTIEYYDGKILISTFGAGIWLFDTKTSKYTHTQAYFNEEITGNAYFQKDNNGNVWMYNYSGNVWMLNPNAAAPVKLELIPANMLAIIDEERFIFCADKYGSIWITTYGNGLFCYEPATNALSHFIHPNTTRLSSNYLLSIILDENENIWIGTENAGVHKLSFSNRNVRLIYPDEDEQKRNRNVVRSMSEDSEGNIWVATKAGSVYKYNNDFSKRQTVFENGYNAYQIMEDSVGNIWMATRGKGIAKLPNGDYNNAIFYQQSDKPGSLSNNGVFCLVHDRKGRLWAATFGGGLCVKLPDTDSFHTFFTDDDWIRFVRYVMEDKKGDLWVATSNGILKFNPDSLLQNPKNFIHYTQNSADTKSLSNPEIRQIFQDSKGQIWVATAGGGICKFVEDGGNGYFITYKNNNGISNNNIMAIQEDISGKLWISTESSLQTFDQETKLFQFYRFSDNFTSNQFSETAALRCRDGRILFGSLNGLYVFNPENLQIENQKNNKVTITEFYIYGEEMDIDISSALLKKSVSYSDKIVLTAADNVFRIEFSTLNFREQSANQFMFILENYENRWNLSGSSNTVTYRKVPPGKYVFKVKCLNGDGTWSENTELEIRIKPPFYNSTLAYIIYLILIIVAIYITIKVITKFNRMNNDIQVERSLTEYKLRFFTNISHEFRTPLTLIRNQVETLVEHKSRMGVKIQNIVNDLDINTNHLLRLIEQLLEFRKLHSNAQKLNLQMIDAVTFFKDIFLVYNSIANKMNIDYQFVSQHENIPIFLDRTKVDKIVFNLLSNAFKFTPRNGKITLSVEADEENDILIIKVSDNGIGIPKEKQHLLFVRFMQINFSETGTGIGLSLVKEFATLHKGSAKYAENAGGGSVFIVELPLSDKLYDKDDFVIETVKNSDIREYKISEFIDADDATFVNSVPEIVLSKKYKILVIDDNDDIRDFLNERLSPYFEIITANNGDIGFYRSTEDDPDLIICDVMMPGMNGFTLTKQLKNDFGTCHIPVILLTAYVSDEYHSEGVEAGADAYITKPFSLRHLMLQISKLIEKHERIREYYGYAANATNEEQQENDNRLSSKDSKFMKLVEEIMEQNLTNKTFSIDDFALQTGTGRTVFFRKIKSLTGYSPNEYIRICRLQKAAKLLKTGRYNVSEVSYMVGIDDPFYFSKCFKAQFGCSPSKYLKE